MNDVSFSCLHVTDMSNTTYHDAIYWIRDTFMYELDVRTAMIMEKAAGEFYFAVFYVKPRWVFGRVSGEGVDHKVAKNFDDLLEMLGPADDDFTEKAKDDSLEKAGIVLAERIGYSRVDVCPRVVGPGPRRLDDPCSYSFSDLFASLSQPDINRFVKEMCDVSGWYWENVVEGGVTFTSFSPKLK